MTKRVVTYDPHMEPDLERWLEEDPQTGRRVVELIELAIASPKSGRGRPKRLGGLPGVWSRRINRHHRVFYYVDDGEILFLSCYGHDLPEHVEQQLREGVYA